MTLQRRLYRSLLQQARSFEKDGLPLLGVAGIADTPLPMELGRASLQFKSLVAKTFRHPPSGVKDEHAFVALRMLAAQHSTLANSDHQALSACKAWHQHMASECNSAAYTARSLSQHANAAWKSSHSTPPSAAAVQPLASYDSGAPSDEISTTPHSFAKSIEQTCSLMLQLHRDSLYSDDDSELTSALLDDEETSDIPEMALEIKQTLETKGLETALDQMTQHVRQLHSDLFPTNHQQALDDAKVTSQDQKLAAVQHYIYQQLKLRHEPIEWLYDGIAPLMPQHAIPARKAAPFTLALIFCMLLARLGMPVIPVRAMPQADPITPQRQALEGGLGMPEDVAIRQAGRAAAYLPTDSWLVAVLRPKPLHDVDAFQSNPLHKMTPALEGSWQLSGLFLDVSRRGGKILNEQQLLASYPDALSGNLKNDVLGRLDDYYLTICADWVRAVMVAHQRRGESDLVAYWLVQVTAALQYQQQQSLRCIYSQGNWFLLQGLIAQTTFGIHKYCSAIHNKLWASFLDQHLDQYQHPYALGVLRQSQLTKTSVSKTIPAVFHNVLGCPD